MRRGVGIVSMALLVLSWWLLQMNAVGLGYAVIYCIPAGIFGSWVGLFVGLFGGVALAVTGVADPGNEGMARPVAGVAAAIPFLALAAAGLADGSGAEGWVLGGWVWWFVVGLMSGAAGAFVGPRVVGFERERRPAEVHDRRPRTLYRCTAFWRTALR
ncbi:MAG TPA: hypothetical protein VN683_03440 [Acidothermaceae bacterium]|nr:hypothetical protein [Acidothermaceae bacterium]